MITRDGRYIDMEPIIHRAMVAAWLVAGGLMLGMVAGYHIRGPVEARQAATQLQRCEARADRLRTERDIAYVAGSGAVAAAQDIIDRVIAGGSREAAAEIKRNLPVEQ